MDSLCEGIREHLSPSKQCLDKKQTIYSSYMYTQILSTPDVIKWKAKLQHTFKTFSVWIKLIIVIKNYNTLPKNFIV